MDTHSRTDPTIMQRTTTYLNIGYLCKVTFVFTGGSHRPPLGSYPYEDPTDFLIVPKDLQILTFTVYYYYKNYFELKKISINNEQLEIKD